MNRQRILFVDDDQAVLDGLENVFRKDRARWDVAYATGGEQALEEMARSPADIVVSDMRMPGMDGAALLSVIKTLYPGTARLVLSGHAERDVVLKAIGFAHQFLSKPCPPDVLRVAIERTCHLQKLLGHPSIRRFVGETSALPSAPRSYIALTEAASRPSARLADIAAIVQADPAMSAKLLQLVNSAYFGLAQHVASIQHAVSYLGVEVIKALALTTAAFGVAEMPSVKGFSLDRLRSDAIHTARLAKRLLPDSHRADEAFTAAIVHDVGYIILARALPAELAEVVERSRTTDEPLENIERAVMGVGHAELGAYLLGVWGLPFSIVESVAYHHRPSAVTVGTRDVLAAVHAADAMLAELGDGQRPATRLDVAFLEEAGYGHEIERWRALANEEAARAKREE